MATERRIKQEHIEAAKALLQSLPVKGKSKTRTEAVAQLEKDLHCALRKGYQLKELCQMIRTKGVSIPNNLLMQLLHAEECMEKKDSLANSKSKTQPPRHEAMENASEGDA